MAGFTIKFSIITQDKKKEKSKNKNKKQCIHQPFTEEAFPKCSKQIC